MHKAIQYTIPYSKKNENGNPIISIHELFEFVKNTKEINEALRGFLNDNEHLEKFKNIIAKQLSSGKAKEDVEIFYGDLTETTIAVSAILIGSIMLEHLNLQMNSIDPELLSHMTNIKI